ncbi:UNVERIFIED_CONTAM: hypothetical protein FKN15_012471 [Acipenser sinensis]
MRGPNSQKKKQISGPVSEESCAPLMIGTALLQKLQLVLALDLVVEPLLELRGVLVWKCVILPLHLVLHWLLWLFRCSPPEGPLLMPSPPEGPLLLPSAPEGPLLLSSPGVVENPALPGVATGPAMQQEILWLEPHEVELPATEKGGERDRDEAEQDQGAPGGEEVGGDRGEQEEQPSDPELGLPEAEEPEAAEPEAEEPEAAQPEAEEPEAAEPEAVEPEAEDPEAVEPEAEDPEAEEPEAEEPEAAQPEAEEPEAAQPEAVQPEAEEPEAAQPEAEEPEAAQPEAEELKQHSLKQCRLKQRSLKQRSLKQRSLKQRSLKRTALSSTE